MTSPRTRSQTVLHVVSKSFLWVMLLAAVVSAKRWEGLVAYWPMDEGSGTTVADVTGQNNGTRDESSGWQAGGAPLLFTNDASINFASNGDSSGQVIRVPDSPSLDSIDVTGQFTIAFWYRLTAPYPQDYAFSGRTNLVFGQDEVRGMQLVLDGGTVTTPGYVIAQDAWQHLVVTYDRATSTAHFYVNGANVHTGTLSSTSLSSDDEWQIHGYLGFVNHNGGTNPAEYDDMRVYKRALGLEEVQELAAGRGEQITWNRNRQVFLNTTSTGANVGGDVTGFPVLVRLNSSNFTFADAETGGADLRFTKAGGIVNLPYEIEQWDDGGQEAEVWVKVDTVYGGNSDQYILMHYGKTGAPDSSSSTDVFSTAESFLGVWHLAESVADGANGLIDATGSSGGNATPNDVAVGGGQTGVSAQIGNGVQLGVGTGIIQTHDVEPQNDMTVSLWVRPTSDNQGNDFVVMDRNCEQEAYCPPGGEPWHMYAIQITGALTPTFRWSSATTTYSASSSASMVLDAWNHVVCQRKGDSLKVFVDGVQTGQTDGVVGPPNDPEWGLKFGGENATSRQFDGYYDEVRVDSVARSPDWVRLCYMNQRADDSLITLGTEVCDEVAITADPQDTTVDDATTATFRVVAIGTGRQYQWYRNTVLISGATSASYSFTATSADSGAAYHCEVTGDCGAPQTSLQAILHVIPPCEAIAFVDSLRDTTATSGQSFTMWVTVTGSEPDYQWRFGGIDIPGATDSSYTIASVALASAGNYDCIVSNRCSIDTASMTLSVCVEPSIATQPQNQEVVADNQAIFQVVAGGTGNSYQWERDTGIGWENIAGATNTQYALLAPLSYDSALFRVHIVNACGDIYSNVCSLFVNPACTPVAVSADPADTSVIEKSPATLRVSATGTGPVYQWLRNGTAISGATGNTYTFNAERWNDGQQYRCVVSGDCGVDTSAAAVLSVTDTTRPHPATTLTLNSLGPTDINVIWDTPESDSTDADSVFVYYSNTAFQHPTSSSKQVLAAQPVGTTTGTQDFTAAGLSAESRYYFTMWLKDTVGNWAYADSDTVSTTPAGVPVNPVVVRGQFVDSTHVTLSLSNFCQLPSSSSPFSLWGEYIGVWYQGGAFAAAPDTSSAEMLRFPLATLKAAAGCPGATYDTTVALPALSGADSLYFFSVSVVWHVPDSIMPFTQANGDSVLMRDISPPANALTIVGAYPGGRSDSATISLGNTGSIEPKVAAVLIACSFDSSFTDTISQKTLSPDSVSTADPFSFVVRNTAFDGGIQTVYCSVVLRSNQGVLSPAVTSSFQVGRDIPSNPISLTAVALSSYEIQLNWPSVAGSGADSIRIYRDTAQIGLNLIDVVTPFQPVYVGGIATADTIGGLNASTVYHFAAQARITGEWTPVSQASRAFASTLAANPSDTIPNTVVIDSGWLDTATNRIMVAWHYPLADSIWYGITFGIDSAAAATASPAEWLEADNATNTSSIQLGTDIVFDTTYYVMIRIRKAGGFPSTLTDDATWAVQMPSYTWQPIVYFTQPTGDTVWAFNNHVALWYEGGSWGFGQFRDTVRVYVPDSPPNGLIPVSPGFSLVRYDDGPSLSVALRYDSIPTGYEAADIRLYHLTPEGQWEVYHDFVAHSARGLLSVSTRLVELVSHQLMLMVDTRRPAMQVLTDIDTPVDPGTSIYDSVQVSDNIGNLIVSILYSRGENAPRPMMLDTLQSTAGTVISTVPGGYVTDDNGVRVYVVVTDGVHFDTLNVSRQVNREQASDISTEADAWVPLRTTAVLDNTGMGPVIADAIGGDGYDNTKCRVFRYFDPDATDGTSDGGHTWVEYTPAAEASFTIVPGRLMWVKTANTHRLDFGAGVTTSLRDTTTLTLPPGTWTDFALPHKFRIYMGDIVDATGGLADSLQFYSWTRGSDGVYVTDATYIATLPEPTLNDKEVLLNSGIRDGYSVFNPTSVNVTLRIPPLTHFMSPYYTVQRVVPKKRVEGSWALKVTGSTSDGGALGTVVLGHDPADTPHPSWYAASPGFGGVFVRACDPATRRTHGHVVSHVFKNGGVTYRLAFVNQTDHEKTIACRVEGLDRLADSLDVRVVDPVFGSSGPGAEPINVTVAAKSVSYRDVTVGGPSYYRTALTTVKPLSRMRAYPNPFRGGVTVQFGLPENVSAVHYRLYDARGRLMWEHVQRNGLRAGVNHVVWDGSLDEARGASAGTYLLQVRAVGSNGRTLATKEQQLIRMP